MFLCMSPSLSEDFGSSTLTVFEKHLHLLSLFLKALRSHGICCINHASDFSAYLL